MSHITRVLLALTVPAIASAQADTTRRADSTRTPPQDTARRVQSESRGEIDVSNLAARFAVGRPNFGFSSQQAIELQQALTRAGCDVGAADGAVGLRTVSGIECFRSQRHLESADFESVLRVLGVSFAQPAPPPPEPAPARRDTTVLPPVLRPDSNYRPDVRARRDSALRRDSVMRRDSLRRDTTARRDTTRRDTTTNRPSR
jgi:peptidoglycan hydrolase-like protein with peptidoglycan-binding domain